MRLNSFPAQLIGASPFLNKFSASLLLNKSAHMNFIKWIPVIPALLISVACLDKHRGGPGVMDGGSSQTSVASGEFKLQLAFPKLEFDMPVELTSPDDGTDRV